MATVWGASPTSRADGRLGFPPGCCPPADPEAEDVCLGGDVIGEADGLHRVRGAPDADADLDIDIEGAEGRSGTRNHDTAHACRGGEGRPPQVWADTIVLIRRSRGKPPLGSRAHSR